MPLTVFFITVIVLTAIYINRSGALQALSPGDMYRLDYGAGGAVGIPDPSILNGPPVLPLP